MATWGRVLGNCSCVALPRAADRHGWPLSHSPRATQHLHVHMQWRECKRIAGAEATRTGWSKGKGVCDDFMKLRLSSGGCETSPARGQPAWGSVASLATGVATRPAMRRYANVWAVGHAATKAMSCRVPRVLFRLKATATSPRWARGGLHLAGSSTTAHAKRTAQEPGRPLFLLGRNR